MVQVILLATLTAAVAQGTPLLITALGEIMTQRSGVLNLGLEGMMLIGAAASFIALVNTNSLILAVLIGALCSGLLALVHAFLSITCRVHQVICGLALNIFAGGLSGYLGKDYNGIAAPKVLPSFRPDPAVNLHKAGFADYLRKLEETVGREISTVEDVRQALSVRIAFFDAHGCRSADHGLDYVMFRPASDMAATAALRKARAGEPLTREEAEGYQTALLLHCAREYARLGWVMQLHFSCMRNPNTKILKTLGPDTGFDCMAVTDSCSATYRLLDTLEQEASLPRTVLYSLNPADNAWIDTLLGAFQSPEIPGKIQHGSAWWFNDHKAGMTEHLTSLANLGVLGNFIGMLTDSRSLLSYARHEYFRRVLCDLLGRWVENGEYPRDMETLGGLVQDICCHNAKRYFNL